MTPEPTNTQPEADQPSVACLKELTAYMEAADTAYLNEQAFGTDAEEMAAARAKYYAAKDSFKIFRRHFPRNAKTEEMEKSTTSGYCTRLVELLNAAYVFIGMPHKALRPWRISLDAWQADVEAETGWNHCNEVMKFDQRRHSGRGQTNDPARPGGGRLSDLLPASRRNGAA